MSKWAAGTGLSGHSETSTNVAAYIALLCALLVLPIPALVFSAIASHQIDRRDHQDGYGLATIALILAVLELVAVVAIAFVFRDAWSSVLDATPS